MIGRGNSQVVRRAFVNVAYLLWNRAVAVCINSPNGISDLFIFPSDLLSVAHFGIQIHENIVTCSVVIVGIPACIGTADRRGSDYMFIERIGFIAVYKLYAVYRNRIVGIALQREYRIAFRVFVARTNYLGSEREHAVVHERNARTVIGHGGIQARQVIAVGAFIPALLRVILGFYLAADERYRHLSARDRIRNIRSVAERDVVVFRILRVYVVPTDCHEILRAVNGFFHGGTYIVYRRSYVYLYMLGAVEELVCAYVLPSLIGQAVAVYRRNGHAFDRDVVRSYGKRSLCRTVRGEVVFVVAAQRPHAQSIAAVLDVDRFVVRTVYSNVEYGHAYFSARRAHGNEVVYKLCGCDLRAAVIYDARIRPLYLYHAFVYGEVFDQRQSLINIARAELDAESYGVLARIPRQAVFKLVAAHLGFALEFGVGGIRADKELDVHKRYVFFLRFRICGRSVVYHIGFFVRERLPRDRAVYRSVIAESIIAYRVIYNELRTRYRVLQEHRNVGLGIHGVVGYGHVLALGIG